MAENGAKLASDVGRKRSMRAWIVLWAALVSMAITAAMGLWQLDRAEQKLALHRALLARGAMPALDAASLARSVDASDSQLHRLVDVFGTWMPEHAVFLENRQMGGRPGLFVVAPLRLSDGSAVVIQRGWAPRNFIDRTRLPELKWPAAVIMVSGRVAVWPSQLPALGLEADGPLRLNLDEQAYVRQVGLPLRPVSIVELPSPQRDDDGLLRDWPEPALNVHKHYGYAAQWFAFCAIIAALYVWFQIICPRKPSREPSGE